MSDRNTYKFLISVLAPDKKRKNANDPWQMEIPLSVGMVR